jgi:hypothetical protein
MKKNSKYDTDFILVNSRKYNIKKIIGYFFVTLSIMIGGAIFARGSDGNFISLFVEIPFWQELVLYIVVFFLFIIGFAFQFNHEDNKGKIHFNSDTINLPDKEINLTNTPATISLNATKEKRIYKRTIKDNGGNNWVEYVKNGKPEKYEFLIPSLKVEEELKGIIDEYIKRGYNVALKSSSTSFWDKINS